MATFDISQKYTFWDRVLVIQIGAHALSSFCRAVQKDMDRRPVVRALWAYNLFCRGQGDDRGRFYIGW